jgi:CheY-like chemotaxis protein
MGHILIIDRDFAGTHPLTQALEHQGDRVTLIANGNEGVAWAREHAPMAIVLSVELTGVSGYAICNKFKKDDALAHIPLVLASSEASAEVFDEHRRLRTRADGYVFKPYDVATVLVELAQAKARASLLPRGAHTQRDADVAQQPTLSAEPAAQAGPIPVDPRAHDDDDDDNHAFRDDDAVHDPLMSTDALLLLEGSVDVNTHTQVINLPMSVRSERTKDLIGAALADIDEGPKSIVQACADRIDDLEATVRAMAATLADNQAIVTQLTDALARLEARQQRLHKDLGAVVQQSLQSCLDVLGQGDKLS